MSVAQLAAGRRPVLLSRVARWRPLTTVASVFCLLFVVVAVIGPFIAPHDPTQTDAISVFGGISGDHLLGTDDLGRDIFSRILVGTRTSLAGPALVIAAATVVGTVVAVAAAWFGGWVDSILTRVIEVVYAFPGLVLGIVAAALFGAGFLAPVVALSIAYVPVIARVIRTSAIRERNLPYIEALQVQGASGWSVCLRHLLPNLVPLVLVQAAVGFGYAMLDLAAISFIGLGIQPPQPDWGVMVANGQASILNGYPQQSLFTAGVIVIAVVSFNLVGERLAQHFDSGGTR